MRSIIKILPSLAGILAGVPCLHANVLAHESFNYSPGPLTGANGGFGFSAGWSIVETFEANPESVVSPGLTHPTFAGTGNAWADISSGDKPSAIRPLDASILSGAGLFDPSTNKIQVGQTVWYSVLMNPTSAAGGMRVKFFGSGSGSERWRQGIGLTMNYRATQNAVEVKIEFGDQSGASPLTFIPFDETSLIVGSFTAGAGLGEDLARVWINPGSLASEAALGAPTLSFQGAFVTSGTFVNFRGNNASLYAVDELRVMSAIPEPSTYGALLGTFALALLICRKKRG